MTSTSAYLCAAAALLGMMAYAVLAGADFGGGVWSLFACGPRKKLQRDAIAAAMGPVWEANHVWLIFVLVILFTCFPRGYRVLMEVLFIPFHLVLGGIMLRGAAFIFRHKYEEMQPQTDVRPRAWGALFGVASIISPLILGLCFGVVTTGQVHVEPDGQVAWRGSWFTSYSIGCALLALTTCAYLAAVYLMVETREALREDFRRRALLGGTATAFFAILVLVASSRDAPWLFEELRSARALPILIFGGIAFLVSAVSVFKNIPKLARASAIIQTVLMLAGWGIAHRDFLIYPNVTLAAASAPGPTLLFMLIAIPLGGLLLIPSLLLLFRIFKFKPLNLNPNSHH
jgi:cytochrome bd ubiquinol oxidase subunit II